MIRFRVPVNGEGEGARTLDLQRGRSADVPVKATLVLLGLVLAAAGVAAYVWLRVDPNAPVELEPDGALFVGGRRVADDEASAQAYFKRHPGPLCLRIAPKTDVVRVLRVLRAAHVAREIQSATVECGGLRETVSLPRGPRVYHPSVLDELALSLCPRESRHDNGEDHLKVPPGALIYVGLERRILDPIPAEDVDRALEGELGTWIRDILKAFQGLGRPPRTLVWACPGIPAEVVLKSCRALREAGAGAAVIVVAGEGSHLWTQGGEASRFKRR